MDIEIRAGMALAVPELRMVTTDGDEVLMTPSDPDTCYVVLLLGVQPRIPTPDTQLDLWETMDEMGWRPKEDVTPEKIEEMAKREPGIRVAKKSKKRGRA